MIVGFSPLGVVDPGNVLVTTSIRVLRNTCGSWSTLAAHMAQLSHAHPVTRRTVAPLVQQSPARDLRVNERSDVASHRLPHKFFSQPSSLVDNVAKGLALPPPRPIAVYTRVQPYRKTPTLPYLYRCGPIICLSIAEIIRVRTLYDLASSPIR